MKKNKIQQVKVSLDISNKLVRVTKITNDMGIPHPNMIESGYTFEGMELAPPTVGKSYSLSSATRMFMTSEVTEVSKGSFKTKNSTYKIEYL